MNIYLDSSISKKIIIIVYLHINTNNDKIHEEGDKMNKKRKILIIGFLAVILAFIFNTFSNASTNKEYKKYLSSYEQNLQERKYEDALSSLNSANELKKVDGFSKKEQECETLQVSLNNYNSGVEYFNKKDYKLAVESFKKVNANDKNYSEAQRKLA